MSTLSGPRSRDYLERLKRLLHDSRLPDGLALTVGYLLPAVLYTVLR